MNNEYPFCNNLFTCVKIYNLSVMIFCWNSSETTNNVIIYSDVICDLPVGGPQS